MHITIQIKVVRVLILSFIVNIDKRNSVVTTLLVLSTS